MHHKSAVGIHSHVARYKKVKKYTTEEREIKIKCRRICVLRTLAVHTESDRSKYSSGFYFCF